MIASHHKAFLFMIPLVPLIWIAIVLLARLRGSDYRWPLFGVCVVAIAADLAYVLWMATRARQESMDAQSRGKSVS